MAGALAAAPWAAVYWGRPVSDGGTRGRRTMSAMRKRWNGWGDETVTMPVPCRRGDAPPGAPGGDRDRVPVDATPRRDRGRRTPGRPGSSPWGALIGVDAEDRLRHARGQPLGDCGPRERPDGARPGRRGPADESPADAVTLLTLGPRTGACAWSPYGGGSSVVGGLGPSELGRASGAAIHRSCPWTWSGWPTSASSTRRRGLATFGPGSPVRAEGRSGRGAGPSATSRSPSSARRSAAGSRPGRAASIRSGSGGSRPVRRRPVETPTGAGAAALPCLGRGPDLRELVLGSEGRWGSSPRRRSDACRCRMSRRRPRILPPGLGARGWPPSAIWRGARLPLR